MHYLVQILVVIFITVTLTASHGQNLVPNPSFEHNTGCPGPNVFLQHTSYWSAIDNHAGTPDLYRSDCPYNRVGTSPMAEGQYPYSGDSFIGLFAHGDMLREYCTVALTKPLVSGQTYLISFMVRPATGYGTVVNSFGLHFSKEKVSGLSPKSLAYVALTEHIGNPSERMLSDTSKWTPITGTYTAEGGEKFITLGNFRSDDETRSAVIKEQCIRPDRSYILIDDVTVKTKSEEPPTNSPPQYAETPSIAVVAKFVSTNNYLTIQIWDHKEIDGDIIDVVLNNKVVLKQYTIRRKKKKITILLDNGTNILSIRALNLGAVPPNTVAVRLSDGEQNRNFVLNSTLNISETIEINYPEPTR